MPLPVVHLKAAWKTVLRHDKYELYKSQGTEGTDMGSEGGRGVSCPMRTTVVPKIE